MYTSQSSRKIRSLLLSLLVVINKETVGDGLEIGIKTPCEQHKKKLIQTTSTRIIDFQRKFDVIIAIAELETETCLLLDQEYKKDNEGLELLDNPCRTWAEHVYEESKDYIEEGSGINAMLTPNLTPYLLKCMKRLLL